MVYISDVDQATVYRVGRNGAISIIVSQYGHQSKGASGGLGVEFGLNSPSSVALDPHGPLYIADSGNHRIVALDGDRVQHVAGVGARGFGGDGGYAGSAVLYSPTGLWFDAGQLYLCDFSNHRVRVIKRDKTIDTIAGNGIKGFAGDGGSARDTSLDGPLSLYVDPELKDVYVSDSGNHRLRRIGVDGVITTVAGNGADGNAGDGGLATKAQLNRPHGVAMDDKGTLYVAVQYSNRVRRITDGVITTLIGSDATSPMGTLNRSRTYA
ncbi:NHL domain-containing protein [Streptomyces sp. 900105245]